MRELSIEEVELVHGGHTPGEDGPSLGGLIEYSLGGGVIGSTIAAVAADARGLVGDAFERATARGAIRGGVAGVGFYAGYYGAKAAGADRLGSRIGKAVYNFFH